MGAVEISTADPATRLKLFDYDRAGFSISLENPSIGIRTKVALVPDIGGGDAAGLVDLFRTMVDQWRGWEGELAWASLEGEVAMSATADSLGHVTLRLRFQNAQGASPWAAEVDLTLEPMQVEEAHRHLARFFSRK